METQNDRSTHNGTPHLADASRNVAHQAVVILENRIELLLVEIQEERNRLMRICFLSVASAIFALLAGVALTVVIAVVCWAYWSPIGGLLIITAIYAVLAGFFYRQVMTLRRDWHSFAATLDELRKDRECLKRNLS